jgi:hypothetical protein
MSAVQQDALTAIAKAREESTSDLIRKSLDAYLIMGEPSITPEQIEEVVEKVTPRVKAMLMAEASVTQNEADRVA